MNEIYLLNILMNDLVIILIPKLLAHLKFSPPVSCAINKRGDFI